MMQKKEITTYRGFEITLDFETGKFSAWSDGYDTEFARGSFNAVKKGVDEYIKENEEFRPFKIQRVFSWNGDKVSVLGKILTITGIRRDGTLVTENGMLITKNYVGEYALYDPSNKELESKLNDLEAKHKILKKMHDKNRADILAQVKAEPVKDIIPELMEKMGYQ